MTDSKRDNRFYQKGEIKMKRRIFSFFLAISLAVSLFAISGTAAAGDIIINENFNSYTLGAPIFGNSKWINPESGATNLYCVNSLIVSDPDTANVGNQVLMVNRYITQTGGNWYDYSSGSEVQVGTNVSNSDYARFRFSDGVEANWFKDGVIEVTAKIMFDDVDKNPVAAIEFEGFADNGNDNVVIIRPDSISIGAGNGVVFPAAITKSFTNLASKTWYDAGVILDLKNDKMTVSFNNVKYETVSFTNPKGNKAVRSIGFQSLRTLDGNGTNGESKWYVDDFKAVDITPELLSELDESAIFSGQVLSSIKKDLNLPAAITASGIDYPVPVTWSSSNTAILSNTGVVTHPMYDTNVTLTASCFSEQKTYKLTVLAPGTEIYNEGFQNIANDTLIEDLEGWSNSAPAYPRGVSYTVAYDPTDTNLENQVLKSERFVLDRGGVWQYADGSSAAAEFPGGPAGNDQVIFSTGAAPISSGGLQIKSRVMFGSDYNTQRIRFYLTGLDKASSDMNILELNRSNGQATLFADNNHAKYMSMGTIVKNTWYDILLFINLDDNTYTFEFTNGAATYKTTSTYGSRGGAENLKQITGVGVVSGRRDDTVATGSSIWYIDDFSIKKIATDEDEIVALDKEILEIPTIFENDYTLPLKGENGSVISWSSSNGSVISNTGVVTYGTTAGTATLTATFTLGSADPITKDFIVTVPAKDIFTINEFNVTLGGQVYNTLVDGGVITSVAIDKNVAFVNNTTMYVVLYKGTALADISIMPISSIMSPKTSDEIVLDNPIELPLTGISGYSLKVMAWDDNYKPLAQ